MPHCDTALYDALTWATTPGGREREQDIGMRDRALYEYLAPLRKKSSWADLICDYYDNPRPKPHNRKGLKLPKKRGKSGLPPFTFAVLDGCRIHGYWDTPGVQELKSILKALEAFAVAPRKSVSVGRAFFEVDGMGSFRIFVNYYDGNRIIAFYDQPVAIELEDVKPLAPLPKIKGP